MKINQRTDCDTRCYIEVCIEPPLGSKRRDAQNASLAPVKVATRKSAVWQETGKVMSATLKGVADAFLLLFAPVSHNLY